MNRDEIIVRLRKGKNILHNDFGIKTIGLYGSYAKSNASNESDIDLAFLPQPGIHIGLEKRIQPRRPPEFTASAVRYAPPGRRVFICSSNKLAV